MFNALSGMIASAQKLQNSGSNLVSLGGNKGTFGDNPELRPDLNPIKTSKKVDISKEMVNQVTAKAEFQANAQVIEAADEAIGTILNIKS